MWAALSRAVRMPSRGEIDGRVVSAVLPPGQPSFPLPVPLVPVVNGNPNMQSEDVTTYELGYRMRRDNLIVDLAVFYNDFDNLRSLVNGAPICQPSGVIVQVDPTCLATATHVESPLLIQNEAEAETTGLEISASRQLREWWRLHGVYTYFHLQDSDSGSVGPQLAIVEDSPDHQVTLRSSMDFNQNIELDIWLRWVDELESQQIEAYTALDLRIAWSPTPSLIVAGGGRNLLAGDHLEFMSELVDLAPVEIEPEAYVNVRWSF
jgi:iron complex outermembrane receptor protein